MNIVNLIDHIRQQPGDNAKMLVLEQNNDNDILRRVLSLAYDTNRYQFGVSANTIEKLIKSRKQNQTTPVTAALSLKYPIEQYSSDVATPEFIKAIAFMERDLGCIFRGNEAKLLMASLIDALPSGEQILITDILRRNLKIDLAPTLINKALGSSLIVQMPYMRCGMFDEKSIKNIHFPAMLQVKMDGTYRQIDVCDGEVTIRTRQGKEEYNPILYSIFMKAPVGSYIGELTIPGVPRVESNGNINSNEPDYDRIVFTAWDYLEPNTDKPYSERFTDLQKNLPKSNNTAVVLTKVVNSVQEVKNTVNYWMSTGLEGGVLKDMKNHYRSGTSKTQLKIKKIVDADVRITGFTLGSIRTSREGKVGAITYSTDDGKVIGKVSGFNENILNDATANPQNYIGKIMTVRFNDIHQGKNGKWALQLPRFIEIRNDKNSADTLERIQDMLGMKRNL